jgi:hypothetical protein
VWPAKSPGHFSLSIYLVEEWMNMRGGMKAVVERGPEFLWHFIASVVNGFIYSGTNRVFIC